MNDGYFITWKAEYSVNIEAIDRQHQGLVALIRQLQEAMSEGRGQAYQKTVIERLVKYTESHLRYEENMLRQQGYESLDDHIAQHRKLESQVRELQQQVCEGRVVSNATVMLFLRNWLTDHIMQQDHQYAKALESRHLND